MTTAAHTAAFTTAPDGKLIGWNRAAALLLGSEADQVIGRPCHDVMGGRDLFDNSYCMPGCPVMRMARQGTAVRPFRLDVNHPSGSSLPLRVSVVAVGGTPDLGPSLVHFLEPVEECLLGRLASETGETFPGATDRRLDGETSREVEVLRLLGAGVGTDDAAAVLGISPRALRDYLASCYRKLEAHTCLGEVRLAERLSMIDDGFRL